MKRYVSLLALWTLASAATGQEYQINVQRPAYDYELIEIVSVADFSAGDREVVSGFLAERQSAIKRAQGGGCPEFLDGKISIEEYAARLDQGIDEMNREIAAAYQQMRDRLSSPGRSRLQSALNSLPLLSADTRAVDILAVAPGAAEASFTDLCNGAVSAGRP